MGTNVEDAFTKNEIVPDVISTAPKNLLKAVYTSGVEANLGNELTPTQVKNAPTVTWDFESGTLYTLVLTDPDAPSRKNATSREFKHWLVANIPENNVDQGDLLAEYIGSGPPVGTGLHRYVFLVYKQPNRISDHTRLGFSPANRRNFKIIEFAKKYNLGDPLAGNFYQAQFDEYVPELHKKLSTPPK